MVVGFEEFQQTKAGVRLVIEQQHVILEQLRTRAEG